MADFKNKIHTASLTHSQETEPTPRKRRPAQPLPQDDVAHTAAGRANAERAERALHQARIAARIADDNRAKEILLLDIRQCHPSDRLLRDRLGQLAAHRPTRSPPRSTRR